MKRTANPLLLFLIERTTLNTVYDTSCAVGTIGRVCGKPYGVPNRSTYAGPEKE